MDMTGKFNQAPFWLQVINSSFPEWWCTKENTRFHFLVIGTAQLATGYTGPTTQIMGPTGRLLILSIKWEEHDGQKRVVCSAKNASITEYPVNSVVPFGQK